jgi:hypothetical protein
MFCFSVSSSSEQINLRNATNNFALSHCDTCIKRTSQVPLNATVIASQAPLNLVVKERNQHPLLVANGVILGVGSDALRNLTPESISSISVLKYPEAVNKFGHMAYNGVIIITTKLKFKSETLREIYRKKFNELKKDSVIFAINGDLVTDTSIKISSESINEIELLKAGVDKGINPKFKHFYCINIWTLEKKDRIGTWRLSYCRTGSNIRYKE